MKPYKRSIFIGSDTKQSGILQGKIIVDLWKKNKSVIDKNNDNVLQYIMLQGIINHPCTIDRTKYSILTINNAGIETRELDTQPCNWEKDCAKITIESLFLKYGDRIEAIIAIGTNLVYGKNPLDGTNYKLDNNGILRMPYEEYEAEGQKIME